MSKQTLVKQALEKGILLSPELLKSLSESELEKFISEKTGTGSVLGPAAGKKAQITVKIKKPKPAAKLTPADVAQFYNKKYTALQSIIRKKLKAVSINKAPDMFSDAAVIGMVKESTSRGFLLEDPTGEIEVVAKAGVKEPAPDDVLGIRGLVREGRLFQRELVLPDVPLNHTHNKISGMSIVLSAGPTDLVGDLVFTPEKTPDKRAIHLDSTPAWVAATKGDKKLLLLAYQPPKPVSPKQAVAWLKKRYLPHARAAVRSPDNPFLITTIPDVLWVIGGEQGKENYKGVTIVSCGQGVAKVDLETMDVDFLE